MAKKSSNGLILIALLLIIVGCSNSSTEIKAPTTPFLGGDGKLEVSFLEGNPPGEITDGNTFPFQAIVKLKNTGEYDIPKDELKVSLIGFLPGQFKSSIESEKFSDSDLTGKKLDSGLSGKKRDGEGNIINSIETFLTFPENTKNFKFSGSEQGNNIFIFRADVCYKYTTKVVSEICILQNQIDKSVKGVCDPYAQKQVFNSASPVKITKFTQNVAGKDKVQFSFDIAHEGNGKLFTPSSPIDCPKEPDSARNKEDFIGIKVDTGLSDGYNLNCAGLSPTSSSGTAAGTLKLTDKQRTVTCTLDLPKSRTDFRKPINIEIGFDYEESADKEILVKHLTD